MVENKLTKYCIRCEDPFNVTEDIKDMCENCVYDIIRSDFVVIEGGKSDDAR